MDVFEYLPLPLKDGIDKAFDSDKNHLPLSRIPAALNLLGIQSDDPQILAVFRNAASGWASHSDLSDNDEQTAVVSRDDWRAVCAVLLEPISTSPSQLEGLDEPDSESDEYVYENEPLDDESSSGADGGSDDEYLDVKSRASPTKRRSSPTDGPRKLTSRQTLECRRAFALFFPDVDMHSDEMDEQKITIQDISRIAKLLKEKIKADEMVEMLETFSTCNDKSMSLRDFEQMMIATKMV